MNMYRHTNYLRIIAVIRYESLIYIFTIVACIRTKSLGDDPLFISHGKTLRVFQNFNYRIIVSNRIRNVSYEAIHPFVNCYCRC